MDTFNIAAGLVTLMSFAYAVYTNIKINHVKEINDKETSQLKRHLGKGLNVLINNLDKIDYMEELDEHTKKTMAVAASGARDHAIALLMSFSDESEIIKTWDWNTEGEFKEKIKQRQERLGVGTGGCILEGQMVNTGDGTLKIEDLKMGCDVLGYDQNMSNVRKGRVVNVEIHNVSNHMLLNKKISVTCDHQVYCKDKGWLEALELMIGDELLNFEGNEEIVKSIEYISSPQKAYAIGTTTANIFVNGILLHNKMK